MNHYSQNPYSKLGGSIGSMMNAFGGAGKTQQQGFMQGQTHAMDMNTKRLAMDTSRLANEKSQIEIDRMGRADNFSAEDLIQALGVSPEVQADFAEYGAGGNPNWGPMAVDPRPISEADQNMIGMGTGIHGFQEMGGGGASPTDLIGMMETFQNQGLMGDMLTGNRMPEDVRNIQAAQKGTYPPEHLGNAGSGNYWEDNNILKQIPQRDRAAFMARGQAKNQDGSQKYSYEENILFTAEYLAETSPEELAAFMTPYLPLLKMKFLNTDDQKNMDRLNGIIGMAQDTLKDTLGRDIGVGGVASVQPGGNNGTIRYGQGPDGQLVPLP